MEKTGGWIEMEFDEITRAIQAAALLLILLLFPASAKCAQATMPALAVGASFEAADTLACGPEENGSAKEMLDSVCWVPSEFSVRLETAKPGYGEWLVRFPSPRPSGDSTSDLVAMEWYAAHDREGDVVEAPAIVVVHESGSQMTVGRLIAQSLSTQGLHSFLLHLPGYGARRAEGLSDVKRILPSLQQAIADVRRARDAVFALPHVDRSVVGVQGTSLGGFVTATVAGLDHGYDRTFILLAGGNLHEVVLHGAKDAEKTHKKLTAAGVTDEQIKEFAWQVEPLRLAHRINAASTWLYSGKYDEVVPPSCSPALARAAHLSSGHHVELPVGHYSGVFYLPLVIQDIAQHTKKP
jgi:dienelactone hydrolase